MAADGSGRRGISAGTMAATIKEVAHRAGVSVGTVSNVLSGLTAVSEALRARVHAAVQELDYHPNYVARSLKTRQTHMLGLVISDITNPFFPQLMRGAEDAAWKHNYVLTTFNTDEQLEREKQILDVLRRRSVDGILMVLSSDGGELSHVKQAAQSAPVVFVDRVPNGSDWDTICADNAGGARDCVAHLISQGHRKIAILAGTQTLHTGRERLRGYLEALKAAGIAPNEELICDCGFRREIACAATDRLLSLEHPPTAIFSCNIMMTLGMLEAVAGLRWRCPENIALATFDDLPMLRAIRPQLTAVAQPAYDLGYRGAEMLIHRIQGKLPEQRVQLILPATVVVRESSASPRA